jgi:hypothetical protein
MTWKRRCWHDLLLALLGGVAANVVYFGLLFTRALHGFAVVALGPAIDIVDRYLDPTYSAGSYRFLEVFGVNIVLYTFWIFVVLIGFGVLRQLMRKLAP